ncbi:TetR/AcrR family transcriptional regulator [Dysgonomonas sp. Marseille-P4677]|uniref:TetR/AcrR family transcriptional regulator n=1 Tax=Dysgonomonas sp. Marseille-P4677 TaxID=2364790 RepID=UPI001912DE4F|nr:TetR/AcrR family transcriptional regulator [Dysgonomonas sp. Marseille-P4677]MBK5721457.1 TetR/AcrR family transcriptional regulator [Dysgonomonas sp. Marseille-P4677]
MKKIEKTDWCEEGLKVLAKEGFQRITIDNLCFLLNKTKGSFYHHFQNIDGYIEALMKYWSQKNTADFIKATEAVANIEEKYIKLNDLTSLASHKSEQVIRAWSFSNKLVKQYLEQVDDFRTEYLIKLNVQSGMNAQKAKDYAVIEYATLIGIQQLCPTISKEEFKRMYGVFIDKVAPHK